MGYQASSKTLVRYEIDGANQGGRAHTGRLIEKLNRSPTARKPTFSIDDLLSDRTKDLGRALNRKGFDVDSRHREIGASGCRVRVKAIDDIQEVARDVGGALLHDVKEVGAVVSTSSFGEDFGGVVCGLGSTITRDATDVQHSTRAVVDVIAHHAGARTSSREMAAAKLNSVQMDNVRNRVHDRLTDRSIDYLEHGVVTPELFVVEGIRGKTYPLVGIEAPRDLKRSALKYAALREILPANESVGCQQGVVFFDSRDPWLYFVLAKRRGSRWGITSQIEFPVAQLEAPRLGFDTSPMQLGRPAQRAAARIYVTD